MRWALLAVMLYLSVAVVVPARAQESGLAPASVLVADVMTDDLESFWSWLVDQVWPAVKGWLQSMVNAAGDVIAFLWHALWNPLDSLIGAILGFMPQDSFFVQALGMVNWIFPVDTLLNVVQKGWGFWIGLWIIKICWRIIPLVH